MTQLLTDYWQTERLYSSLSSYLEEGESSSFIDVHNDVTQLQLYLPWLPNLQLAQKSIRERRQHRRLFLSKRLHVESQRQVWSYVWASKGSRQSSRTNLCLHASRPLVLRLGGLLRSGGALLGPRRSPARHGVRQLHEEELLPARQLELLQQLGQVRRLRFGHLRPATARGRLRTCQTRRTHESKTKTCHRYAPGRFHVWRKRRVFSRVALVLKLWDWHRGSWMGVSLASFLRPGSSMNCISQYWFWLMMSWLLLL